ncbi:MAG: MmgE/PrpD family protein [Pseudolabrys sp.]
MEIRGPVSGKEFPDRRRRRLRNPAPRIGQCMGQVHLGGGWHPCGTLGAFASAASSSSVLGLSEDQTVHALGLAGSQASGIMAVQYGAMMKRGHAGRSCQSGLYAAVLAEEGFTGITNVFDRPVRRLLHDVFAIHRSLRSQRTHGGGWAPTSRPCASA